MALTVDEFWEYAKAMSVLQAEEMQRAFVANDWPNMKEAARNKKWKELEAQARVMTKSKEGKKLSNKDLAELLSKR